MNRFISKVTIIVICLVFAALPIVNMCATASRAALINTKEFLLNFNLYAATTNLGHTLSLDNAEISRFSDQTLLKTVFNGCEVLALNLTPDTTQVLSIRCTWSTLAPGSSKYSDDFACLLMETLCACGLDTSSISDVFLKIGFLDACEVGDKGDVTIKGIRVSYEVTSSVGVSFLIEKT